MEARPAVEHLLVRYGELIDAADFDALGRLFSHGRLCGPDGTTLAEGAHGVAAFFRSSLVLHEGSPRTKHLVTNIVIADQGNRTASARSSYLVLQAIDASLDPIVTGRYEDRFGEIDGEWCFVERRYFVDLTGDLSRHLRFDVIEESHR